MDGGLVQTNLKARATTLEVSKAHVGRRETLRQFLGPSSSLAGIHDGYGAKEAERHRG